MSNIAEAFVTLRPDFKGFEGETRSGLNRALLGVGAIAASAGAAIVGGLAVAGGLGLNIAADFQQTTIAFEGLLGSAQAAQSFLGQLRDFAARTPFELPGLATAAQQLIGVGFASEEVIPTLESIGNTAAALGAGSQSIDSVVRALGQMRGKGKASAEELQQVAEALPGFSPIQAIAEGLGISIPEAFDRMARGAIPAEQAIDLIIQGMESFPGAAGAMDRQSQTLNGVLSTFKDTLSGIAIDFITPYLPAISSGIQSLSNWLTGTAVPALKGFINFFTGDGPETLSSAGEGVGPKLEMIASKIGDWIVAAVPMIAEKLVQWGSAFAEWVLPMIPPLLEKLGELVTAISRWMVDTALPAFQEKFPVWVASFVDWVNEVYPPMLEELGKLLHALLLWMGEEAAPRISEKLLEWAAAFAAWVVRDAVPALITKLGELGVAVSGWITLTALPMIVEKLAEWAQAFIAWVVDATLAMPGKLAVLSKTITGWAAGIPGAILAAIGNLAETLFSKGSELIGGFISGIRSRAADVARAINDAIPGGSFRSGVADALGNLPGFAMGGIVPGPIGAPMIAVVHGGEKVLTPAQQAGGMMTFTWNQQAPVYGVDDLQSTILRAFEAAGLSGIRQRTRAA